MGEKGKRVGVMDGPSEEWCKSLENVREAQWESNCEEIMCLKKLGLLFLPLR